MNAKGKDSLRWRAMSPNVGATLGHRAHMHLKLLQETRVPISILEPLRSELHKKIYERKALDIFAETGYVRIFCSINVL